MTEWSLSETDHSNYNQVNVAYQFSNFIFPSIIKWCTKYTILISFSLILIKTEAKESQKEHFLTTRSIRMYHLCFSPMVWRNDKIEMSYVWSLRNTKLYILKDRANTVHFKCFQSILKDLIWKNLSGSQTLLTELIHHHFYELYESRMAQVCMSICYTIVEFIFWMRK